MAFYESSPSSSIRLKTIMCIHKMLLSARSRTRILNLNLFIYILFLLCLFGSNTWLKIASLKKELINTSKSKNRHMCVYDNSLIARKGVEREGEREKKIILMSRVVVVTEIKIVLINNYQQARQPNSQQASKGKW